MQTREAFNVTEAGLPDGQVMLFAHGFGCDQNMWRHVAPQFEDRYRVITFDYVGSGGARATYDADRYASLAGYAADVLRICHDLELRDVVFVGHSVSAMIGVLADVEDPDVFADLVMVGPSPRYIDDGDYRGGFEPADIDSLLDSLASNYLGWSAAMGPAIMGAPDRPELGEELAASFCTVDPTIAEAFARATFLADNRADLLEVKTPCLVLQSREDIIAGPAVGTYVADHLANATLTVLDATGHCPHLSAPGAVVDAMNEYLKTRV